MKIKASLRKEIGTKSSRRLRNINNVPGVIYGENILVKNIFINHNFLYLLIQKKYFYSKIYKLEISNNIENVLLRDYQLHAYKKKILHVDFQRVNFKKKIFIKIPLYFLNYEISPAKKISSGIINYFIDNVLITCFPKYLPKFINVDLSKIKINQSIYLSDLILPKGVKLFFKKNSIVVNVHPLKNKQE
ncbi:50S ribosomal protein L25/general stress protein Ctc [Candidatus Zinderia endosymbiont of Aphrophora alni]|uniref:50S ribosomal protein L25/general stress protein Ctc n=1 Tax=Candidatus Zinderia endosymbiont of Aphrophora alni TaxID=3077951 RepID=UPI0030D49559